MYKQFTNSESEHDGRHNNMRKDDLCTLNVSENFLAYSFVIIARC
jgi:hypothetical protein